MPVRLRLPSAALLLLAACAAPRAASAPAAAPEAPADERVYAITEVEVQPQLRNAREFTRTLARTFPPTLRYAGVRGWATVTFIVQPNGLVRAVHVIRSSHEAFIQPTADAVQQMRFSPGMIDGRPVSVRIEQPIDWEIGGNPQP